MASRGAQFDQLRPFFISVAMVVIAITGGIACGKTIVAKDLEKRLRASFFSCDDSVASLLEEEEIQDSILQLLDSCEIEHSGKFEKAKVRKEAFENSEFREKLEELIHPMVLEQAVEFLQRHQNESDYSLVEVPLLYEVSFPIPRNLDLVVAASPPTQLSRLIENRKLETVVAKQILAAQLPMEEKISRADVVVWNDGSTNALTNQIEHLALRCAP